MSELQKLRQEHADLILMVGRIVEVIAEADLPPLAELANLRRELSSTLVAHLIAEDSTLYPRLMSSADPEVAATARAFSDEMGGLAAAYNLYAERWDSTSIAGNWRRFCNETRDILGALSNRIVHENRELYPLLEALDDAD